MNDYIDLYCERLDPSFWAEPANALTNLAFFVAAFVLWRRLRAVPQAGDLRGLAWLIALVGAASFAFHTLATRWAMWLDQVFILIFMLAYLHRFVTRLLRWNAWAAAGSLLVFGGLNGVLIRALAALPLNGSQLYAGALLVLALMAAGAAWRRWPAAPPLGLAVGLLLVSVTLRSFDQLACVRWPLGTHFLWHVLNAAVLYCCVEGLRRHSRPGGA